MALKRFGGGVIHSEVRTVNKPDVDRLYIVRGKSEKAKKMIGSMRDLSELIAMKN